MQFSYFPNAVLKAILILIFIACVLFGTYKQLEGTFLALVVVENDIISH